VWLLQLRLRLAAEIPVAGPNLSCPPKPAQIGWACCKLPCCRGRDCRESPRLKAYIPYRLHRSLTQQTAPSSATRLTVAGASAPLPQALQPCFRVYDCCWCAAVRGSVPATRKVPQQLLLSRKRVKPFPGLPYQGPRVSGPLPQRSRRPFAAAASPWLRPRRVQPPNRRGSNP
jgi:hypothetical protein